MGWIVFYALVAAIWLVAAWSRGVIGGRRHREQAALRFAREAGLPVDDPPDAGLVRRVVRRHRFVLAGALTGFALGLAGPDSGWLMSALLYVGVAAGAVVARFTEPRPAVDSPRFAHATEIRVTDYVPPWIVAMVALGAGAAVVLAAYVLTARGPFPLRTPDPDLDEVVQPTRWMTSDAEVVATAAVAVAATALAVVLARLVVDRRRAATSTAELAVDDALRASAVRDCLQLSAAVSFTALISISFALTEPSVADLPRRIGGWAPGVMLAALAIVHVAFQATRGAQRWRARLHAQPAAA